MLGHYSTAAERIVLSVLKGVTKAGDLESRVFLLNLDSRAESLSC